MPAFTSISPEQQREQLRPAESWPFLRITWSPNDRQLLGDARHFATKTDVKAIRLHGNPLLIGPQLWWYVLTEGYASDLEVEALREHSSEHQWFPYRELMSRFLRWAASASAEERTTFLHGCREHATDFGDAPIAALDFNGIVDVLAGISKVTPKLLRVVALHWLAQWQAGRDGKTLAYAKAVKYEKDNDKVGWGLGPAPLSCREWQTELLKHETSGRLLTPDARTKLTALALVPEASAAPNSATSPPWKKLLRSHALVEDADMIRQLEGLRTLPDASAPVISAALSSLITDGGFDLGTRVAIQLSQAKTAAELSLAANSAWTGCTSSQRLRLRVQLAEFLKEVITQYGPAVDSAAVNTTLARLAPVIMAAQQRGYSSWSTAAAAVSRCDALPPTVLGPLSTAVDIETFRLGIRNTLNHLVTTVQHDALVEKVTDVLSSAGPASTDWFVSGALRPSATMAARAPGMGAQSSVQASASPNPCAARALSLATPTVATGFQPPTSMPATSCIRVSGLDTCSTVEATSELSVALGTPIYVDQEDIKRGYAFATISPELYNNLFSLTSKRVFAFLSGASCTMSAHGANNEAYIADTDKHLNVAPAERQVESGRPKRKLVTTPKLNKSQRRQREAQAAVSNPPGPKTAESQLHVAPPHDQSTGHQVQYARGHTWDGYRQN